MGVLIDEGSPQDCHSIQLVTRERRWIRNVRLPELPPERMKAAERTCHGSHPMIITRSLSATYNCFGMVFASRRTAITAPQELGHILHDDGYRRVSTRAEVKVGDVVVYRHAPGAEIAHVGIVIHVEHRLGQADVTITVLSQWGRDGEYIHNEADVPEVYGEHREYYSERRVALCSGPRRFVR